MVGAWLGLATCGPGFLSAQPPSPTSAPAASGSEINGPDARPTPQTIPSDLWGIILAGGPVMIPIGICSFIALAFGIERLAVLRPRRVIPRDFVKRFIEHLENGKLDRDSALELCETNHSPVAEVFAHGVRKWGKPSVEVEQAIIDGGERQVSQLRKNLRVLNAVATVSPLMGLFGTVVGMIMCFNQIASTSAMGKAEQLAGGIGVALITTAAGLAVAIPSLILYMYLIGRVDGLVMEMDLMAQKVVSLISLEGLADPLPAKAAKKSASPAAEAKPSKPVPAG
jgi:biopolymer transport protein ExbB